MGMQKERDNENLAEFIDTKIKLNFEIDKDERYWEQRNRANWLKLGEKTQLFSTIMHPIIDEEPLYGV